MAKHTKTLLGSIQPKLGTLQSTDGTNTEVGQETFNELMNSHYPSHTHAKGTQYTNKSTSLNALASQHNEWINTGRVSKALCSFQAKKSPGPDGIKPIIFPYFPVSFMEQIVIIYKACITLEFTPTCLLYTSPSPRD